MSRKRRGIPEVAEEMVDTNSPDRTLRAISYYLVAVWNWRPPHPLVPLMELKRDRLRAKNTPAADQVAALLDYADEIGVGDHLRDYLERTKEAPLRDRLRVRAPAPRTPEADAEAERLLHKWPPKPDVGLWRGTDHFTPQSEPKQNRRTR